MLAELARARVVERLSREPELAAEVIPLCAEFQRRLEHPMWTYKPDAAEDRDQLGFHRSEVPIRMIKGGSQAGKSRPVAQEIIWWLTGTHPYRNVPKGPLRIYLLSALYKTIEEGVLRHLRALVPEWLVVRWGPLCSGSDIPRYLTVRARDESGQEVVNRVDFLSAEAAEEARKKVQAAAVDLVVIDEEIPDVMWEELQARRLATGGEVVISATLVRSEEWLLKLEDRWLQGDKGIKVFTFTTAAAMRAGHVSERVYREMESTLSEEEKEVRLFGLSRRQHGLVYPEFAEANLVEPFEIPREWTRYCALDPGWRTFAVLWAAVAPDGKYFLYRELYQHARTVHEVAALIFAAEGYRFDRDLNRWTYSEQSEPIQVRWIDPSGFGHHETGELKVGGILSTKHGIACVPAVNDTDAGIELCRRDLMADLDGLPRCRVFRTCENFLKERATYRRYRDTRDKSKRERSDSPVKRQDHLLDCWKYMVLGGLDPKVKKDPYAVDLLSIDVSPPARGALPMDERYRRHWARILRQQRLGREPPANRYLGRER